MLQYAQHHYSGSFQQLHIQEAGSLGTFDAIISFETKEHLNDLLEALSALLFALKPGGMLIMSFPLNHPDDIYHKTVFSPNSVAGLLTENFGQRLFKQDSFYSQTFL